MFFVCKFENKHVHVDIPFNAHDPFPVSYVHSKNRLSQIM